MRTWVIIDLLLVSALVGAWIGWRISKRKVEQARAAADAAASSATEVATLPPRRAPASVPAFSTAGRPRTAAPAEKSKLQVVVDVAQGRGEDVLASLRPALGMDVPGELDSAAHPSAWSDADTAGESDAESVEEVVEAAAESDAESVEEVVEAAAESDAESVEEVVEAAAELESEVDGEDEEAAVDTAAESDAPGKNGDVDVRRTTDVSGPLGADRLIFHTDNAPALLTKVLTGLRDRGYEIEMVVHHEVILHDVDAGVARICVAHSGDDVAAAGGLAPTQVTDGPMVV